MVGEYIGWKLPRKQPVIAPNSLAEISRRDISSLGGAVSITEVKHLASYNWIEAPTPTIAVPGSPSLWTVRGAPRQLKKDFRPTAQRTTRHQANSLEPLFRALYVADPSFDISSIDVVTNRNNIRKLLSFIAPSSTRDAPQSFTINVEVTKNTAVFSRNETANHASTRPDEYKGLGYEFEKAYTTSQIDGSTGHHRIVSYRVGNLSYIVRHETDAFVDTDTKMLSNSRQPETDDLSGVLGSSFLSTNEHPPTVPAGSNLTVREEGQIIPLEAILEIKTHVAHKPLSIEKVAPQLWVSQTLKLVRAYHHNGVFQRPVVEDVAAQIKIWEERNQTILKKLAALIEEIRNVVERGGGIGTVEYDVEKDKLMVWKGQS